MADGEVKIDITADDSEAEKKLKNVEDAAEDTADSLEDLGDGAEKGKKGLGLLDVAAGNLVAGGISALISGIGNAISSLVGLAEETREYREDMAKLQTAFKTTGKSVESAEKTYKDFYAILGESDRSVEAVNHLAELTNNTEELSKWSTIAAGVTAKFGDSLPIEGLTEAANETAKVGAVTGPLADALNWAGISEEKFNEQLAKCNSEQARATLITNTLNKEYTAAAAEYNTLTAETQAARRATAEMEEAQARLGAAFEPVATIVTEAKTAFFNFAATLAEDVAQSIDAHMERTTGLDKAQRALRESVNLAAEEMREMSIASDTAAQGINSQYDYVQSLADELFRLADESGKVKDADKARADFILGELAKATGEQYTMTGNQINKYGELKNSIYEVINAERARLLLAEYEDDYTKALADRSAAEQAAANHAVAMIEAKNAAEEAALNEETKRAELQKELASGVTRERATQIGQILKDLAHETSEKQKFYEKQAEEYQRLDGVAKETNESIAHYEEAKTLILGGKTEEAIKYIDKWRNGYLSASGDIVEANAKEKKDLEAKVVYTSVQLGLLEEEYAEKGKGMTDAQKKEMEKRIAAAKEEAQKARAEYYEVGGDSIEGLVKGVEDKDGNPSWNLAGKLAGIVQKGIEAMRKKLDSHSPSRVTMAIGGDTVDGLIIGVEKKRKEAVETVRGLGNDLVKEATKKADEAIKVIEDKIEHLDEIRTKDNAKQIDAQKKQLRKDLEAAREREKVISDFARDYEKQLSDITKLEEEYAKESARIQEQLNTDIEKALENYQNKFDSKVESIKNSLSLFDSANIGKAVDGKTLTNALNTQVSALERYNKALTRLSEKDVNAAFIEEMKQLGVSYLPQLEAINLMTDKELEKYVELWEEKNRLATDAATEALEGARAETEKEISKLRTEAAQEAETLRLEYNEALLKLVGEISEKMLQAGEAGIESLGKTLDGYVKSGNAMMESIAEGIAEGKSDVVKAATDAVKEAIAAAQSLAGMKSSLEATVNAENASYGAKTGTADTGFTELARAVGVQTAATNSLANDYRTGAGRSSTVVIELNGRELGRAVVDTGNAENTRYGTKLVTGGAL